MQTLFCQCPLLPAHLLSTQVELVPNASAQLLLEAEATQERTPEAGARDERTL